MKVKGKKIPDAKHVVLKPPPEYPVSQKRRSMKITPAVDNHVELHNRLVLTPKKLLREIKFRVRPVQVLRLNNIEQCVQICIFP